MGELGDTVPPDRSVSDQLLQHAIEQAIRADEKARSAHERLDRTDDAMTEFSRELGVVREAVSELKVAIGKINARVGFAAALGGLVGSGVIAALLKFVG